MTGGRSALWVDEGIADTIALKATQFIARHKDEPFFLYMGTNDVHVPRVPHPRFAGKSGLGTRGDVILQLDWTIGEEMRTLASLGIADNTLLVFASDNGPGTRVPFIVRWPSCVKPGEQSAGFSQIDVYRSLAALTGVALPEGAAPDSRNHLPELLGMGHSDREYVIEQNRQNTLAIRCGEWKYLEPSDRQSYEYRKSVELGNSPRPQLFCISKDPCERHDVAEQYPGIVEELATKLNAVKSGRK